MKVILIFRLAEQWCNITPVINGLFKHCIHSNLPSNDLYHIHGETRHGEYKRVLPDTSPQQSADSCFHRYRIHETYQPYLLLERASSFQQNPYDDWPSSVDTNHLVPSQPVSTFALLQDFERG